MIEQFFAQPAPLNCPAVLFQADEDPVVEPRSAEHLLGHLQCDNKRIEWVESNRHGIINEDIHDTQSRIIDSLAENLERFGYNDDSADH